VYTTGKPAEQINSIKLTAEANNIIQKNAMKKCFSCIIVFNFSKNFFRLSDFSVGQIQ
jgi:hypothetical protein